MDEFIRNIDVKAFSLKETIGLYSLYKKGNNLGEGIALLEVVNV